MTRRAARAKTLGCCIGYVRCSTAEQATEGASLPAQRAAITAYAAANDLTITGWAEDPGVSGSVPPERRPGLSAALAALRRCDAGTLLAVRTDRLSRSTLDLLTLAETATRQGWVLRTTDGSVDMSTPAGELMTTVLAAVAKMERSLIAQRVREGMAAKKAAGARFGHPTAVDDETLRFIVSARADGLSLRRIAEELTSRGVPTRRGGPWRESTVRSVLASERARAVSA